MTPAEREQLYKRIAADRSRLGGDDPLSGIYGPEVPAVGGPAPEPAPFVDPVPDGYAEGPAEGPGMDPSELATPDFMRHPQAPAAPPLVKADEGDGTYLGALEKAQRADEEAQQATAFSNASKKFAAALSRGSYKPDLAQPPPSQVPAEIARQKAVQDYLLRKRGIDLDELKTQNEAGLRMATLEASKARAESDRKHKLEDREAEDAEWNRRNEITSKQAEQRARIMASQRQEFADRDRPLTSEQASQLAAFDTADELIGQMEQQYQDMAKGGMGERGSAVIPGSGYISGLKARVQTIGQGLEGGKLTDTDFDKYFGMAPQPTDTPERATAKLQALRAVSKAKRDAFMRSLSAGGYRVKSASAPPASAAASVDDVLAAFGK